MAENKTNDRSKYIDYDGESHTVAEWSAKFKIPRTSMYGRIKLGWSMEKIKNTPIDNYKYNSSHKLTIEECFGKDTEIYKIVKAAVDRGELKFD